MLFVFTTTWVKIKLILILSLSPQYVSWAYDVNHLPQDRSTAVHGLPDACRRQQRVRRDNVRLGHHDNHAGQWVTVEPCRKAPSKRQSQVYNYFVLFIFFLLCSLYVESIYNEIHLLRCRRCCSIIIQLLLQIQITTIGHLRSGSNWRSLIWLDEIRHVIVA